MMMLTLLTAGLVAAAAFTVAADGPHVHAVELEHRGTATRATYHGHTQIEARTVGVAGPGGRMSTQRCQWRAHVAVERALPAGSEPRLVARDMIAQGSRAGSCVPARGTIAAEVARVHDRRIAQHVAEVAAADRSAALAEIDRSLDLARSAG
jgi:hypothetical protein